MTELEFAALSGRAQVRVLREAAGRVLKQYRVKPSALKLLNHGFNTVFRVDTATGEKFALRINVNSRRPLSHVRAEIAWVKALARDTDLWVPRVVPNKTGEDIVMLSGVLSRALPCVLFEWLPGPLAAGVLEDKDESKRGPALELLGEAMAKLHVHAATFKLPRGSTLFKTTSVFFEEPQYIFKTQNENLPASRLEVVQAVYTHTQTVLDAAWANDTGRVIHSDLHAWNLKLFRGRLIVFDFDDCAIGLPVQDIATSLYYLESGTTIPSVREALQRGYERIAPWPVQNEAQLEALIAARGLLLANSVLKMLNPEIIKILPGFFERLEKRLRRYLEVWGA